MNRDNPFPANAVATTSLSGQVNLRTEYFEAAEKKAADYMLNFAHSEGPSFLVLGIRGKYGSGKTHLALQIMDAVRLEAKKKNIDCVTIIAKADRPDLLSIYSQQVAGKLRDIDFKMLAAGYYKKILNEKAETARRRAATASEAGSSGSIDQPNLSELASQAVRQYGSGNPDYILELVRKNLLPADDFLTRASEELRDTDPSLREDFVRAYSTLLEREFSSEALRWIQGQPLSERAAAGVTLTFPKIDQQHARDALKFLLTAYRRAGVVVVFCLDEFERFGQSPNTTPQAAEAPNSRNNIENAIRNVIKDLAETFEESGQVLIISGIEQAWSSLTEDVFHRITWDNIIQAQMSRDDARGLLRIYCDSMKLSFREVFEDPAIELLFEVSGLNARRLLQIAFHSFIVARGRQIKTEDIRNGAGKALGDLHRTETVKSDIEKAATETGLQARAAAGTNSVFLEDAGRPSVIVHLMRSLFRVEEVRDAREIASSVIESALGNPQVRTCTVVVGYSSDSVRRELSKSVDRVLIYDEDRFLDEFREFLHWALRTASEPIHRELDQERYSKLEQTAAIQEKRLTDAIEREEKSRSTRVDEHRRMRTGERILNLLTEISQDLRSEEMFSLHREDKVDSSALGRVLRHVDSQRNLLREAEYLNNGLHDSRLFLEAIVEYRSLLDDAEECWKRAYTKDWANAGPLEKTYSPRRQSIGLMESVQIRRSDADRLGRFSFLAPLLRWPIWLQILFVIAILAIGVFIYVAEGKWQNKKSVNQEFSGKVGEIRNALNALSDSVMTQSLNLGVDDKKTFDYFLAAIVREQRAWERAFGDFRFAGGNSMATSQSADHYISRLASSVSPSRISDLESSLKETDDILRALQASLAQESEMSFLFLRVVPGITGVLLLPALILFAVFGVRGILHRRKH